MAQLKRLEHLELFGEELVLDAETLVRLAQLPALAHLAVAGLDSLIVRALGAFVLDAAASVSEAKAGHAPCVALWALFSRLLLCCSAGGRCGGRSGPTAC